ncbi:hypothetical protein ACJJTC_009912 [Scirpophaga incertulas]
MTSRSQRHDGDVINGTSHGPPAAASPAAARRPPEPALTASLVRLGAFAGLHPLPPSPGAEHRGGGPSVRPVPGGEEGPADGHLPRQGKCAERDAAGPGRGSQGPPLQGGPRSAPRARGSRC